MSTTSIEHCEHIESCVFFNGKMARMPSMTNLIKRQFCLAAFEKCARYMVRAKLGADNVPGDLYPSDIDQAKRLVGLA